MTQEQFIKTLAEKAGWWIEVPSLMNIPGFGRVSVKSFLYFHRRGKGMALVSYRLLIRLAAEACDLYAIRSGELYCYMQVTEGAEKRSSKYIYPTPEATLEAGLREVLGANK